MLSFIRIFEIQHNRQYSIAFIEWVVNCFHLSVSLRYNTTFETKLCPKSQLWIAFIYPYLWDTTQLFLPLATEQLSCELLSFIRIFEIQHNRNFYCNRYILVVNCFHLSVSLRYNTTSSIFLLKFLLLWIAFIYPYLWDTTQQALLPLLGGRCCELLSFIRIFEIQHNQYRNTAVCSYVVNCFHLSVSLRYNTTSQRHKQKLNRLWIAFIYPYLWDTTQPLQIEYHNDCSCELLSFIRIFEIQHNFRLAHKSGIEVVNCFHLSVSLRYNTTYNSH